MGAEHWFGSLQLAYKYIVVFLALLFLAIVAGGFKVLVDRGRLKKAKAAELEAGPKEDTVELNQREKDEGDLFGIRAIEAGFYAGVAQSRPTSRAGSVRSVHHPAMSTTTLVGGNASSPLMKAHFNNNSVLSLHLGGNDVSSQQRAPSPGSKLRPSDAELNGRRHHGAVDMSLHVPSSPGAASQIPPQGTYNPTFGGSDSESDGFASPRSLSPTDDAYSQHYSPGSTLPKSDTLPVSYHAGDDQYVRSQAASLSDSPGASPTPPAPSNPPTARLPTIPKSALRKDSRSPSPEYHNPYVRVYEPNNQLAHSISGPAPPQLQPRTYAPSHHRDVSDASSTYSNGNRSCTFQAYQAYQKQVDRSGSAASNESSDEHRRSQSNAPPTISLFPAVATTVVTETAPAASSLQPRGIQDARLSEFYEAYYRNSQIAPLQNGGEEARTPFERHSTILEVYTPMASPMFPRFPGT